MLVAAACFFLMQFNYYCPWSGIAELCLNFQVSKEALEYRNILSKWERFVVENEAQQFRPAKVDPTQQCLTLEDDMERMERLYKDSSTIRVDIARLQEADRKRHLSSSVKRRRVLYVTTFESMLTFMSRWWFQSFHAAANYDPWEVHIWGRGYAWSLDASSDLHATTVHFYVRVPA
jgi:hypothetical protein